MAVLTFAAGCATPISNDPFTEEAAFLAALPSADTWSSPYELQHQPVGPDEVLRAALASAATWDGWVEGPVVLGGALRSREPDARTDVARRWRRREVNANFVGAALAAPEPRRVWVEAEVVRLEDGAYRSAIAVASSQDGPLVEVGVGVRDGGATDADWDLDALLGVLGAGPGPGRLQLRLEPDDDPVLRELDGAVGDEVGAAQWQLAGLDRMGFGAPLAVTTDGETWPAAAGLTEVPEIGGILEGTLFTPDGELGFTACWDGAGRTVFRGGDAGIAAQGDRSRCATPPE